MKPRKTYPGWHHMAYFSEKDFDSDFEVSILNGVAPHEVDSFLHRAFDLALAALLYRQKKIKLKPFPSKDGRWIHYEECG